MRRHCDYGEREERGAPCKKTTQAVKQDLQLLDHIESLGGPHLDKLCYQLEKLGKSQFERLPYWEQSMRPPELMHILEVTSKRLVETVKGTREIQSKTKSKKRPKQPRTRDRAATASKASQGKDANQILIQSEEESDEEESDEEESDGGDPESKAVTGTPEEPNEGKSAADACGDERRKNQVSRECCCCSVASTA